MKKTNLVFAGALSVLAASCSEDYLDRPPMGVQTEDNFYESPGAGLKTVANCYLQFHDFWGYEAARAELGNMATDDSDKGGSDAGDRPFVTDLGFGRALSSNETLEGFWRACYRGIGECNIALEKLPEAALIDESGSLIAEETRNRYLAEARFLRAWFYFDLVRVFGGVPLLTQTLTGDDRTSLVRAGSHEVFQFIEQELTAVGEEGSLPSRTDLPAGELGRATREAAWALLARAQLFFAKDDPALFEKAAGNARKVIESGAFALHPEFQEIFLENGYQTGEAVFSIIRGDNPAEQITGSNTPVFCSPRGGTGGWGFDQPTRDLVNEFEAGDPRLLFTILEPGDRFPRNAQGQEEVLDFSTYPSTGYHNRKVYLPESRRGQAFGSDAWTFHPIRYADVLLMYAEALLESGGDRQEVADYINQVRRRASNSSRTDAEALHRERTIADQALPDVQASDDLRAAVRHERRVELALEYQRLYDLMRWGVLVETMQAYSEKPYANGKGGNFREGVNEVFPVPQSEIDRSGGSIEQNAGY